MKTFEEYEYEILECVDQNGIFSAKMIFAFYSGISYSQFYELNLNKSDTLKKALNNNKNRTKHSMLLEWRKSENATLQIALFKILATNKELKKLAMVYSDQKVDLKVTGIKPIEWVKTKDVED
jgi:hypothetical protein